MGAQDFNCAPKFPQNGDFRPQIFHKIFQQKESLAAG